MGYAMKNKTYGEMVRAIEYVGEQYGLLGHKLERLTFDRESSIVAAQEDIEARGVKLILKAAGQKVGLAEVSIRLIREKAIHEASDRDKTRRERRWRPNVYRGAQ